MKRIALIALIALMTTTGFAQMMNRQSKTITIRRTETPKSSVVDFSNPAEPVQGTVVYGRIVGNDTLLTVYLPEVNIDLMSRYWEITETYQGRRLVRNVRKVYPYAKLAAVKLHEYDTLLASTNSEAERRRMMKDAEDEITAQYTEELTHLTFSQGIILIRLIDRETGNTSYNLVQELRGRVRAFFYQGFARLWGYNLKTEYDPRNNPEDDEIETIMTLLERGVI